VNTYEAIAVAGVAAMASSLLTMLVGSRHRRRLEAGFKWRTYRMAHGY
jgi:hypothetical protein